MKMRLVLATLLSTTIVTPSLIAQNSAPIIQPGPIGKAPKNLTSDEATKLAENRYSPADVLFMQGMIVHHQQAVDMAALVKERTNNENIIAVAGRIDASQKDEMKFMRGWLDDRSESLTIAGLGHAHHTMRGMASPVQMLKLAEARSTAFDKLFLKLMIAHHDGALDMVDDLLEYPGTAYDPIMAQFTDDVERDQKAEIERMNAVYGGLSNDPRAILKAGFADAGEAIQNLRKVSSLPKPAGFFNPANPAGLKPKKPKKDKTKEDNVAEKDKNGKEKKPEFSKRAPLLSFSNTDMAFSNDLLVAGNYHGWNAYRLGKDGRPTLVSSVVCPGGQGDVSIVGNLLLMSVQDTRARTDCGLQGTERKISKERFRGLRIFDISDITRPLQVGQVQTCRGSHTHSVIKQTKNTLIV